MFARGVNRTLGIQEIVKQEIMASLFIDGSILQYLLLGRGMQSHVLLAESANMGVDVVSVL